MKYLVRFVLFWYDFLVGDAWVVAAGVVIALVVAGLLLYGQPALAEVLGPVLAVVVMALVGGSIWLEWRKRSAQS
jgi:hypothetical protein